MIDTAIEFLDKTDYVKSDINRNNNAPIIISKPVTDNVSEPVNVVEPVKSDVTANQNKQISREKSWANICKNEIVPIIIPTKISNKKKKIANRKKNIKNTTTVVEDKVDSVKDKVEPAEIEDKVEDKVDTIEDKVGSIEVENKVDTIEVEVESIEVENKVDTIKIEDKVDTIVVDKVPVIIKPQLFVTTTVVDPVWGTYEEKIPIDQYKSIETACGPLIGMFMKKTFPSGEVKYIQIYIQESDIEIINRFY